MGGRKKLLDKLQVWRAVFSFEKLCSIQLMITFLFFFLHWLQENVLRNVPMFRTFSKKVLKYKKKYLYN